MKTVFLFSGQGSQTPGMAVELTHASKAAKEVFDCASDVLHFDLLDKCASGAPEDLAVTTVAQPAIMATSLAALACVRERGIEAEGVAGHSLGEYAAMVASGMISMENGFKLIEKRAAAMGKCAETSGGMMAAIMGLPADEIGKICAEVAEKTGRSVLPVNYNSTAQTVIAGENEAVKAACEAFVSMGKKAVPLKVASAFHSRLMQPAADEFYEAAKSFSFDAPSIEFYSNLTGGKLTDFSDMPSYLARHIVSPVRFTDELAAMQAAGYERYIELGPGKTLAGLVKRTLSGVTIFNVENQKTLDKACE